MSDLEIWTIGTGNRSIKEFLNLLAEFRIEAIVDVRRFPTSRHKHFKQENLKPNLDRSSIEYHHVTELGGYRKGGYTKYLNTEEFERGLDYVEKLATSKRVAIMCAERLFSSCHRRFIADLLKQHGLTVIHIIDPGLCSEHKGRKRNRRLDEF